MLIVLEPHFLHLVGHLRGEKENMTVYLKVYPIFRHPCKRLQFALIVLHQSGYIAAEHQPVCQPRHTRVGHVQHFFHSRAIHELLVLTIRKHSESQINLVNH